MPRRWKHILIQREREGGREGEKEGGKEREEKRQRWRRRGAVEWK